ncbi:hypothetical protein SEA_LENNON_8 [Gordonia phage Lennon]|uniref:Helix-turn-helix DNA binding protein n=12 Tax=Vividuovirus TaxID=2560251 RepID=A0A2U9PFR5_9CAUD|nr:hypothetical protein BJD57_gp06 [Gordonia phage Vivi2]YP_009615758.1 hypothetical protein FDI74_gp08 [Gordonia phage Lennon]YP_010096800.1 helix-turn-helix DNA binding protein [Gordonia phage Rofo]YP_010097901.1 hypothetical protein KNU06_gp08 [Gordonia phage Angelicage]YP_010099085.1 hypothetical protein KNU17_gp08 [Gordonia phage Ailee]YP_010099168.1 helix-turn-helix DNA binding protein [Gordonia phage Bibwit]YP_010099418.1 hypothetical protein KNU21_gp03 [Gordonia phage Nordenberg]YP_0
MTSTALAHQLNVDPTEFDLDAALVDVHNSIGPLGKHHRLTADEIDMVWELVEPHRNY